LAYLVDTNIIIFARDGVEAVLQKLYDHQGSVLLSALSLVELQRGILKDKANAAVRTERIRVILEHIPVLPFDETAAKCYGQIIAQCGFARSRDFDRMIAAHVLAVGATLITNNAADFQDVPNLKWENWAMA